MSKYLALDKFQTLSKIIKQHGGIKGTFLNIFRYVSFQNFGVYVFWFFRRDEAKLGELVGEDSLGNKYYENKSYFYGRL